MTETLITSCAHGLYEGCVIRLSKHPRLWHKVAAKIGINWNPGYKTRYVKDVTSSYTVETETPLARFWRLTAQPLLESLGE